MQPVLGKTESTSRSCWSEATMRGKGSLQPVGQHAHTCLSMKEGPGAGKAERLREAEREDWRGPEMHRYTGKEP